VVDGQEEASRFVLDENRAQERALSQVETLECLGADGLG
jgi:hypothetical protein